MRLSYLTVNLMRGSLCKCDLNVKYNDVDNCGECVLFSFFFFLGQYCFGSSSFSNFVLCFLAGSFPGIILNKCEQILFFLGFCVFNAVNDAIIFSLASPSLLPFQGKQVPEILHWRKILCKRDGSGGRVLSGCPGCYLGSIRVCPYNRDVAIIFLPTEYAASFSCSQVFYVWLGDDYIR